MISFHFNRFWCCSGSHRPQSSITHPLFDEMVIFESLNPGPREQGSLQRARDELAEAHRGSKGKEESTIFHTQQAAVVVDGFDHQQSSAPRCQQEKF